MAQTAKYKGIKQWMKQIIQVNITSAVEKACLDPERNYVITDAMMENKDLSSWINDEILSCSVCFGQYTADNRPKLLACSHTFCERCIKDFMRGDRRNKTAQCPVCRQETEVGGGVARLSNNYTVLSLMDMVQRAQHAPTADTVHCPSSTNTLPAAKQTDRNSPSFGSSERPDDDDREVGRTGDTRDNNNHDRWTARNMDTATTPCQTCLQLHQGVEYYDDGETRAYCGHRQQVRPPPVNPDYNSMACGYIADGRYTYESYVEEQPMAGYLADGRDDVTYVDDRLVSYPDVDSHVTYIAPGVTTEVTAYGEGSLYEDFATRMRINDGDVTGCGHHMHSSTGYGMPMQVSAAPYQTAHYHTQLVSQAATALPTAVTHPSVMSAMTSDVSQSDVGLYTSGLQSTVARSHSPPPAYSEIDQNPQPSGVQSTASPDPGKQIRNAKPAAGKTDTPNVKRKSGQKHAAKNSPKIAHRRVEEQKHVKSTAAQPEPTSSSDHHGNSNGDVKGNATQPPRSPAVRRVAPRPPAPAANNKPTAVEADRQSTSSASDDDRCTRRTSGPITPPRRLPGEPQGLPFKCVKRFECHSDAQAQSADGPKRTRVSVSKLGDYVIVTDTDQMTVETLTYNGEYLYKFKALGVQGACMWAKDKLAVATHHGVDICTIGGYKELELPIGSCLNTVPYRYGFIAVRTKTLLFFNNAGHQTRELLKKRHRSSPFKKFTAFEQIKDIAVSVNKDIAVLETGGNVYVIDDDGLVKYVIQPENESCGRLADPYSLTFDRWSNVFVTDLASARVLRFSPNGKYSRCVLDFGATGGETTRKNAELQPYGLSTSSESDHLVVVIGGKKTAEVRIYKLY